MSDDSAPAADLWAFALKVYGSANVSAACLDLQETFRADVPVLLTALWMAKRGERLDASGMDAMESHIGLWRSGMVQPLRVLRRRLKSGPKPAPSGETEALRDEIKRAELHAEKIELATLALWVDQTFQPAGQAGFRENLEAALAYYSGGASIPETLLAPLLKAAEAD